MGKSTRDLILVLLTVLGATVLGAAAPAHARDVSYRYELRKMSWSQEDYAAFAQFVREVSEDRENCNNVDRCFKQSKKASIVELRNRLSHGNSETWRKMATEVKFKSDCADFGKYLEGVFATSRGLPFAYRELVDAKNPDGERHNAKGEIDDRYTRFGNKILKMHTVNPENIDKYFTNDGGKKVFLGKMVNDLSTGSYRTDPRSANDQASDYYSPKLAKLRVGSIAYDSTGHLGVISDIDATTGKIQLVDAHPDNSVTVKTFDDTWTHGLKPEHGAGFRNIRPGRARIAGVDADGRRRLVTDYPADDQLPNASVEQYARRTDGYYDWKGPDGKTYQVTFLDKLRLEASGGKAKVDLASDFRSSLKAICLAIFERLNAIEAATAAGVDQRAHPDRIPRNLPMGGDATWQSYATAGRDSRLKTQIQAASILPARSRYYESQGLPVLTSRGDSDAALGGVLESEDQQCSSGAYTNGRKLGYKKSNGAFKALTMKQVFERIHLFSFDPYHCPERRWGATTAEELASCKEDAAKKQWYQAQQSQRNRADRGSTDPGDVTIAELNASPAVQNPAKGFNPYLVFQNRAPAEAVATAVHQ